MRREDPKMRAIRGQGLKGLFIMLVGVGLCFLMAQGHDTRALDQDPTPLMPGVIVMSLGGLLILVARIRMVCHKPSILGKSAAKGLVKSILEEI